MAKQNGSQPTPGSVPLERFGKRMRFTFDEGLATLGRHIARGSGAWVPMQYVDPDGFRLGAWIKNQRVALRAGRLSDEQRAALATRGLTESQLGDRLAHGIGSFERYLAAHQGSLPAQNYRDPEGFPLGQWFRLRRLEARRGTLDERVRHLFSAAGLDAWAHPWPRQDDGETRFAAALDAYRRYVAQHGRPPRRGTRIADGRDLAAWVMNQRISLRLGRVPEERRQALEAAGVAARLGTRIERDAAFRSALDGLRAFVAANGHDRVPRSVRLPNGQALADYIYNWRRRLKTGSMRVHERAALIDAGMTLDARPTGPRLGGPAGRASTVVLRWTGPPKRCAGRYSTRRTT